MKNPFKKSKTNTKSRVVVGGKKKTPRSKWKIGYLSLVGLLLFTSIGYAGYAYTKTRSLKAHASAGTYLGYVSGYPQLQGIGFRSYACKQYLPTFFGTYWKVHVTTFASKAVPSGFGGKIETNRYNKVVYSAYSPGWLYGFINGVDGYALVSSPDRIHVLIQTPSGAGYTFVNNYNAEQLANC